MGFPNQHQVESFKKKYPPGTRIELESMHGEEDMHKGLTGTVKHIDGAGQLHIAWDTGRTLALIPDVDRFRVISKQPDDMDADIRADSTGEKKKPDCPLLGANGNIYNLAAIAMTTLKDNGQEQDAQEMLKRIRESRIYDAALKVIEEYVNMVEAVEPDFDMLSTDTDKALQILM